MVLPYDDVGEGPPVMLLHAGIADRSMWREHLEPLAAAGRRVIAPDLPGFGLAPPSAAHWIDVAETIDAVGAGPVALVGNSFGAAVALRVAVVTPEKVSALALFGCPVEAEPSAQLLAVWDAEDAAIERGDVDAAVQLMLDTWVLPDAPAAQRELVAGAQRRAYQLAADAPDPAPDPVEDDPSLLGGIAVPVLAAAGDRDLPDYVEGVEWLAQAIPGARREIVPGAGHLVPLDAPEAFRRLVLELLREQ